MSFVGFVGALASAIGTLLLFYGPQEAQYWLTKDNKASIRKKATELANKIATDTTLANQIIDNVNNKKMEMASSLINASPFSSAYSKVMKEVKNLDAQRAEAQESLKGIDKITHKYNQAMDDLTQESEKTFTGALADRVPSIIQKGKQFGSNVLQGGRNFIDNVRSKFKEVL